MAYMTPSMRLDAISSVRNTIKILKADQSRKDDKAIDYFVGLLSAMRSYHLTSIATRLERHAIEKSSRRQFLKLFGHI